MTSVSRILLYIARPGRARDALATRLQAAGFELHTASTAIEAFAQIAARMPGALLVDLGVDDCRRLFRQLDLDARTRRLPRFAAITPKRGRDTGLLVAAAFPRPLVPEHVARALDALVPRPVVHLPTEPAPIPPPVRVVARRRFDERFEEILGATPAALGASS